ncbi:MAG: IclR family transcriptional regulator [Acidimicrobiales bacterium]
MPGILDADSVGRFSRPFDVLELLAGHPGGMTLTEISTRLELPTSSTHNILHRMVSSELITVTGDLQYSLGARAVRLGFRIVDSLQVQVRMVARKHLQELARDTGEHVYLAVVLGRRVVYVERVLGTRAVGVDIRLGQSLFLHATSVGKLFAAHNDQLHRRLLAEPRPRMTERTLVEPAEIEAELQQIRETGFAVSNEEAISGVVGFAVPVNDARGVLVAAIHISALRSQVSPEREKVLLSAAASAAAGIEKELGRTQPAARW